MTDRKIVTIGIILVAVIGLGVVGVLINQSPQVPPSGEPPGDDSDIVKNDGLEAWAEAIYWQDFIPAIPEEGPPFYTSICVNVTNKGNTTVTNFYAGRVTIYFLNSMVPLATLDLMSNIQYFIWPLIRPGESVVFEFTNIRESIFSPSVEEGVVLYSRVLTGWGNGSEMILTTPPSALVYTF
ncbi:MAG: hypothetical protein ACXAEF_08995 [Candidatus Thorarchaeota archaeon]|jgi:hypothetical protein